MVCPRSMLHPRTIVRRVLLTWLCLVSAQTARAQLASTDADALAAVVNAELRDTKTPGAALALVKGERIVWTKGYGVSSVETGAPVTPDMLFRLGSTTKMFTAAAVVAMVERGTLQLDRPIGDVVAGLHPAIAALTLERLLTHTAGMRDEAPMFGRHDDDALLAQARAMAAGWAFTGPGAIYSYSNPGFWLAGVAAQEAAGRPYADVLADLLFKPVGMSHTTVRPTLAMTYPLAQGHDVEKGAPTIVRPAADNSASWPAGSIFSSVLDLSRWAIAFMNRGSIDGSPAISPTLIETLATPRVPIPGSTAQYGLGLDVDRHHDLRRISHDGSRAGYGSRIVMLPDRQIAVIALANRTGSSMPKSVQRAVELLLDAAPEAAPSPAPVTAPTDAEARHLVGRYQQSPSDGVDLVVAGTSLQLRVAGQPPRDVVARGNGRYSARGEAGVDAIDFVIVEGRDGATYLHRGGRSFKRVSAGR